MYVDVVHRPHVAALGREKPVELVADQHHAHVDRGHVDRRRLESRLQLRLRERLIDRRRR